MSEKNDFLESLKVDKETLAKLDKVSKDYNNNKDTKSAKKNDDGGRERGDEGPGKQGREPGLKSAGKVSAMRADMKANSNANTPKGRLSQNGQAVQNAGKTTAPAGNGQNSAGKAAGNGHSGHGTTGNTGANGGHGNAGGGHGGH